jgi:hypothetical protein
MSKDTRRDVILVLFLVSAAGMTSVFRGCRILAWVVIVSSDLYLSIVLLLAALLSDDERFLDKHSWMTGFFPRRRTAGLLVVTLLFLAVVSGFAGLYVGTEVFSSVKTPLDALYISSFTIGLHRLLAEAWLWSTCSARSARQWSSFTGCTFSLTHLTNLHFQTHINASYR